MTIDEAILKARIDADTVRAYGKTFNVDIIDEEWAALFRSSLSSSGFAVIEKDVK